MTTTGIIGTLEGEKYNEGDEPDPDLRWVPKAATSTRVAHRRVPAKCCDLCSFHLIEGERDTTWSEYRGYGHENGKKKAQAGC